MESRIDLDVMAAIHSGTVTIKRRLEIYESDGETLWMPASETPRMIGGSVTVDYGRDERRALDVSLDNSDGILNHNPDGFWYDKILKVYRGLEFRNTKISPSVLIIRDDTTYTDSIIPILRKMGFTDITDRSDQTESLSLDDFYGFDIIAYNAAHSTWSDQYHYDLLTGAYEAGFSLLTIGDDTDHTRLPFATASVIKGGSEIWEFHHPDFDTPLAHGWTDGQVGSSGTGSIVTGLDPTARPAAIWAYASTTTYPVIYAQNPNGARWVHQQPMLSLGVNERQNAVIEQSIKWLYSFADARSFEFQIGEFCVDSIDQENFPSILRVTGRDYTKRLIGSKFEQSLTFSQGTSVDTIVRAVAANASVRKFLLGASGATLGADISFERGTERWKAIKDVCMASGVEVFFNRQGYLVTRQFLDPTNSPIAVVLKTGKNGGNLAKFSKRSTDARVRNIIIVTSENQDDLGSGNIWFGRAENTEPSSPTRTSRLGDRHEFIKTTLVRSDDDCVALAMQRLRIAALEEYELNFSSLVYPWLEVGEILRFEDPDPGRDEPDRYLLSTLTIPMSLGPMSGTGKRVTIVGNGTVPGQVLQSFGSEAQ